MNLYVIIVAIVLFIVFLFILFRIMLKKGLKLSLFGDSIDLIPIPLERSINIGKNSNQGVVYTDSLNKKPRKISLAKNKPRKPKLLSNKNEPKRIKRRLPLNKEGNEVVLINNALKKTEPKENPVSLAKNEFTNKSVGENKASLGLKVNSFEDIYKFLGNSGISDIVHYFEINDIELINSRDIERKISSSADFEESIKNKIVDFLSNQYYDLKDKISELRKNGRDMRDAEFILLSVPLKIRLLSANFSKKDFDLVIKKIESIKEILKNYK